MQYQLSDFFFIAEPENLTAHSQDTYILLTWDAVLDDEFQYYLLERSTDPEFSYNVVNTYLPSNQYEDHDIEFETEYFYRVSYNSGGEWSEYSEIISITMQWMNIGNSKGLPNDYRLNQNCPNPFNPTTTLSYELPKDILVNIVIYDTMGKIIKTLVNGFQTSGYKTIKWDATNEQDYPVSAGLYIYKIQAGHFVDTKKMILLK